MVPEIWVNIGSGNGLLPDGTKPLPEPLLTDQQQSPMTFILGQFYKRCLINQSLKSIWKLHIQNFIQINLVGIPVGVPFNSLAPGRYGSNFENHYTE